MSDIPVPVPLFPHLEVKDRVNMHEAAQRLLASGSILRDESSQRELYDWCQNRTALLEEWASLLGLKLTWLREERILLAQPESPALMRKLKLDETVIILALWYDYDTEVRDQGAHRVSYSVREFNERFSSKFNKIKPPSETRLEKIFQLLDRKNLIRFTNANPLTAAVIEILPTMRFAIPFTSLEEWTRLKTQFETGVPTNLENTDAEVGDES
jgi:hypothetical protein